MRSYLGFFCMLWLRLGFSSIPSRFPPASVTAVPSCLPQIFSLLRLSCSFRSSSPFATSCASNCYFALTRLMLSSVLQVLHLQFLGCPGAAFPAFLLVFYRKDFTDCLVYLSLLWSSGCILSPALVLLRPVCIAMFSVAF